MRLSWSLRARHAPRVWSCTEPEPAIVPATRVVSSLVEFLGYRSVLAAPGKTARRQQEKRRSGRDPTGEHATPAYSHVFPHSLKTHFWFPPARLRV